ncbi:bifunctional Ribosomal protein L3/RNA-binding domain superfamily/RNA recognition motif domain/Nucleotide-binding alpha-beta plait domain superfamily/Translation protein [Babesia duncani]|uniref:Large ribosomal subunit protein uL3c n=1 Tax=Babesia duncani TaxID=323732 RepID=A0AAD9PKG8_9APIC|nr:bifunctional Ribosomal protein L3/RNA-binding domain superfamily/RNA recognition motif domain/Nucleotide-binding alpha-beta plait domain superfamily/Translation protein [Babesia duncani]
MPPRKTAKASETKKKSPAAKKKAPATRKKSAANEPDPELETQQDDTVEEQTSDIVQEQYEDLDVQQQSYEDSQDPDGTFDEPKDDNVTYYEPQDEEGTYDEPQGEDGALEDPNQNIDNEQYTSVDDQTGNDTETNGQNSDPAQPGRPALDERINSNRIFVTRIAFEVTKEDLEDYFKTFGTIVDAYCPKQLGNANFNKGFGFISFLEEEAINKVFETSPHVIMGREVIVDRATGTKHHSNDGNNRRNEGYRNERFKRPHDSSNRGPDKYYRRDRDDRSRTFNAAGRGGPYRHDAGGFDPNKTVSFVFSGASRQDSYSHDYESSKAHQPYYQRQQGPPPQQQRPRPTPKLFIGRISFDTTVQSMRNYFSQFGEIVDAYIPRDTETQRSKGFGFLTFANKHSIHAVLNPGVKHILDVYGIHASNRHAHKTRFNLKCAFVPQNRQIQLNPFTIHLRHKDAGLEKDLPKGSRVLIVRNPEDPRPYLWKVRWPDLANTVTLRARKHSVGQIWSPDGILETVTALQVVPCTICEFMDFGYALVSYGKPLWERRWNSRPDLGKLLKVGANHAQLVPIKLTPPENYVLGQIMDVTAFAGCTHVKVTGITKGKGFAGVIKRHGFKRGPMSHGSKHHRGVGSIGASTTPGCVKPGKRMPGHMGCRQCTFRKLKVLGINPETSLMYIKGLVAGAKGSFVTVTSDMHSPPPESLLR